MSAPIKAGLILAVGSAAATTTYFGVFHWSEPNKHHLLNDSGFLTTDSGSTANTLSADYSNKYAKDYARFLAGVKDNDGWWKWVFKNKYSKEESKGKFKDINKAVKDGDSDSDKNLRDTCHEAYKAATTDVVTGDNVTDSQFKEEQVWLFCTSVGKKPKKISDMANSEDEDKKKLDSDWKSGFGKSGETELLSIYSKDNNEAWNELNSQYGKEKIDSGFFKSGQGKSIKQLCESAYSKSTTSDASSGENPKEADVYKWCSLRGYKLAS